MTADERCIDYRGQIVMISRAVRAHIVDRHPEVEPYLAQLCDVLSDPDLVYSRARTKTHLYYKHGICSGEFTGAYLVAYVRYNDSGDRSVGTAYSTSTPASGDVNIYDRYDRRDLL